jgi:hypothetical protein
MKVVEVYLDKERFNPRVNATIPGSWVAVLDNGNSFPLCRDYEAYNETEAMKFLNDKEWFHAN